MPFCRIETSQAVTEEKAKDLVPRASAFVSKLIGKPEQWVMVRLDANSAMSFGGKTDPAAFVALKSLGLDKHLCDEYARLICGFLSDELEVPADRVFIEFTDLKRDMFAWNGETF